jgi:hypothetical protein
MMKVTSNQEHLQETQDLAREDIGQIVAAQARVLSDKDQGMDLVCFREMAVLMRK